jgi:hypothetical protein
MDCMVSRLDEPYEQFFAKSLMFSPLQIRIEVDEPAGWESMVSEAVLLGLV